MDKSEAGTVVDSRLKWFYKIGGMAALIAGALFLMAVLDLIIASLQPGTLIGWFSLVQDNWLVVIFKLHAGFEGVQIDRLHILDFLDIAILALVGMTVLGLYFALRKASKTWALIALAQPFLGILLFIGTENAGRSSVMGAVLVMAAVMLRNHGFNKAVAYMGILASVLLLTGDFSAGIIPPSKIVATLFGIGYLLLMSWFFLIAGKLFRLDGAS